MNPLATPPPEVMELLRRRFLAPTYLPPPELTPEELRLLAPWLDVGEREFVDHRDRRGRRISLWEMAIRLENRGYAIVRQTHLPNRLEVSTIWLPLSYPFLFETLVFRERPHGCGESLPDVGWRWYTEEEALAGHERIVERWRFRRAPRPSAEKPPIGYMLRQMQREAARTLTAHRPRQTDSGVPPYPA